MPVDAAQDVSQQLSRDCGLGHLGADITPVAHDLDQPVSERRQRPVPHGVVSKFATGISETIVVSPSTLEPGNSGGPIYDQKGNIVGVVVSQLNKVKFAKMVGSIPENVNFGIKASTVRQFLSSSGLPSKWSERSKRISTRDLAKIAKNQAVMVICQK